MMDVLLSLIGGSTGPLALVVAAIVGAITLYLRGRSTGRRDAENAAKVEDLRTANSIRKEAAHARADAAADRPPAGSVLPDDGWRRD